MLPNWLKQLAAECPEKDRRQLEQVLEMHKNQVNADRRYREKQRERGVVPVKIMCPVDRVDELKALVRQWRDSNESQN